MRRGLGGAMNMPDGEDILQVAEQLSQELIEVLKPAIHAIIEALKNVAEALRPLVKYQLEQRNYIQMMMSEEYQTAAKQNPKLNYLALCAKKRRVRIKNIKRLYKLGKKLR